MSIVVDVIGASALAAVDSRKNVKNLVLSLQNDSIFDYMGVCQILTNVVFQVFLLVTIFSELVEVTPKLKFADAIFSKEIEVNTDSRSMCFHLLLLVAIFNIIPLGAQCMQSRWNIKLTILVLIALILQQSLV